MVTGQKIRAPKKKGPQKNWSNMCMKIAGSFWGVSKKTPTYPCNIRQTLQPPVYQVNPYIFVFWGTWVMFQGFVGNFLEGPTIFNYSSCMLKNVQHMSNISQGQWFDKIIYDKKIGAEWAQKTVISRGP